jgi:hypothetical protein
VADVVHRAAGVDAVHAAGALGASERKWDRPARLVPFPPLRPITLARTSEDPGLCAARTLVDLRRSRLTTGLRLHLPPLAVGSVVHVPDAPWKWSCRSTNDARQSPVDHKRPAAGSASVNAPRKLDLPEAATASGIRRFHRSQEWPTAPARRPAWPGRPQRRCLIGRILSGLLGVPLPQAHPPRHYPGSSPRRPRRAQAFRRFAGGELVVFAATLPNIRFTPC